MPPSCAADMWTFLPRDVSRLICSLLGDVDMLGYLFSVSKEWPVTPDEALCREVALRIYSSQAKKKSLMKVEKWGGWKKMLMRRPRLRMNGFYSLCTKYRKPPCNDAFWNEKILEYPEVQFYRYLRFFLDGTCLYALTTSSSESLRKELLRGKPIEKILYAGQYIVCKGEAIVQVCTHYSNVRFRMKISHANDDTESCCKGNHNRLIILEHHTSALSTPMIDLTLSMEEQLVELQDAQRNNWVRHSIPFGRSFEFQRDWRFSDLDNL